MEIRREGRESLDELRPLWLALHAHHQRCAPGLAPYVDDDTSWAARRGAYERWLALPESFLLVVRRDSRAIAYAMVRVEPAGSEWTDTWIVGDRIAELETLVVAPGERGRGIGGALLDAVEAELADRGIGDVLIGVVPGNDAAQALYERRGYAPTWTLLSRFSARSPRRTRQPG
jgi:ribosomal protein S18 acetylase RimI-like enzyme